ncbi:MAG: alpha-isopropylmalate synthase regulatory domain-containing protein [Pseudomonadota bacterium]|nr:alpha-isopropylmalate synthase regulatory domain-containing protein [Pseudomonadota bacterium]
MLCDNNGGTLPYEVSEIVTAVTTVVPGARLGVYCHNDTENAVANSLAAVRAGCRQVQGTINGLGERCGNANLISLIPSLTLKMGLNTGIDADGLTALTRLSRLLDQRLDRVPNSHAAYVGAAAFAHKGGLHVSAVQKDPRTYEHIPPQAVGNRRYIVVSDQAGKSNILARLAELGIDVDKHDPQVGRLVEEIKTLEAHGYAFDEAEASFELMARGFLGQVPAFFEIERFRVMDERRFNARGQVVVESEATALVRIGGQRRHEVAVGNGPVNALDTALRKALEPLYPSLDGLRLLDYNVRIPPPSADGDGTDAGTGVIIESGAAAGQVWRTLGVSANIIDASVRALADSLTYKLMRDGVTPAAR